MRIYPGRAATIIAAVCLIAVLVVGAQVSRALPENSTLGRIKIEDDTSTIKFSKIGFSGEKGKCSKK